MALFAFFRVLIRAHISLSVSTEGEEWVLGTDYEPVPLHFKIPHGFSLYEATSVAVDSHDEVYCFNRGNMPVLVFDKVGNLLRYWGNPVPYEGTETYTDPYGNEVRVRAVSCEWLL